MNCDRFNGPELDAKELTLKDPCNFPNQRGKLLVSRRDLLLLFEGYGVLEVVKNRDNNRLNGSIFIDTSSKADSVRIIQDYEGMAIDRKEMVFVNMNAIEINKSSIFDRLSVRKPKHRIKNFYDFKSKLSLFNWHSTFKNKRHFLPKQKPFLTSYISPAKIQLLSKLGNDLDEYMQK
uniref:RRM domain-containing protein n=1 Tax=Rhabditophanes sp. KR3021 TaxID=114890 RepID=A0AC35TUW2_9BILA